MEAAATWRGTLRRLVRPATIIALLGGCTAGVGGPGPADTGSLSVTIENLPAGVSGAVTVSNGQGYTHLVVAAETLSRLRPGNYSIGAAAVTGSGVTYTPAPATQSAAVVAGATVISTVTYAVVPPTYAPITPGFHVRTMVADGITRGYQIYIPPGYDPDVSHRLILFCHGSGENGSDNVQQTQVGLGKYIRANGDVFPDVVVFPQLPTSLGDNAPGALTAFRIYKTALDLTVAEVHTDLSRVLVTGVSSGATFTWTMAFQEPNRYAAIAPIAFWLFGKRMTINDAVDNPTGRTLALAQFPTFPIHEYWGQSNGDPSFQADQSVLSTNPNYSLIEVLGANHVQTWDFTYADSAFWTWFRAQHR